MLRVVPVGVERGVRERFTMEGDWVDGGGGWGVVEVAKFQPGGGGLVGMFVDSPFWWGNFFL